MSDNIPFDIQKEIIKRVPHAKSLIRFRSVSKPWKSFIDTSKFIKSYGSRHTNPRSHILSLSLDFQDRFICLVDNDNINETYFKVQKQELCPFVMSPLLKHYVSKGVGACSGLLCLYGFHSGYEKWMLVVWNPSIGKAFGIDAPMVIGDGTHYGFGVCPVTKDPTIVKIKHDFGVSRHVEVFTLSSRVWNVIPSSNISESVRLFKRTHVAIDRFIYWVARDMDSANARYVVVSFDLVTKEFKVVDLPNSVTKELYRRRPVSLCVSKLRESLVVYVDGEKCCGVWVMGQNSSFKKFTIGAPVDKILGFTKSGEAIFEIREADMSTTLYVYDPCSQQIKNLGISGEDSSSMFMGSYMESLLLLDHPDSHVYSHDS